MTSVATDTSLRELVDTFYEGFSGDMALLTQAVTPDWEDIPPAPGQGPGPDGAKPIIEGIGSTFANFRIVVNDIVDGRGADGNGMIAVRAAMQGRHIGEFFGVPATNRDYSIAIHEFHEIRDGQIARTYHLEDWAGWLNEARAAAEG